jgi:hypothetical protein
MMPRPCIRPKKVLQVITAITAQCSSRGTALQGQAQHLQHELAKRMHRFGRQCRGMGKVFVTLVRQTETQLLDLGQPVLALARATQACRHGTPQLSEDQRVRLDTQLTAALQAHHRIEHQSRRLTQGKALSHCKIVNAYDSTIAPICKGKSNYPAQFGRKPGIIAEPAAGFIFALHLPVGNPSDASYVEPLIDKVEQAIARVGTRPTPAIHSLAGDLALNDAALREALHERGILTVGIPRTVEPLPPSPTPEDVFRSLEDADLHHIRTPTRCSSPTRVGTAVPWSKASLRACCAVERRASPTKVTAVRSSKRGWPSWRTTRQSWSAFTSIGSRSGHACTAEGCACDAVKSINTMPQ